MSIVYRVPQATVIIFERLGRFSRVGLSGLRFRLPFLDTPKRLDGWTEAVRVTGEEPIYIELSEQQTDTKPRTIITRDNVEMMADATVFWQIIDPVRAVYEVDNLPRSITDLAVTTLRNLLGAMTLNDALGARMRINEGLLLELEATSRKWGVRVNRVELQELRAANEGASGAMLQQMSSEREREATIARAEGERRARVLKAEGVAGAARALVDADLEIYQQACSVMGEAQAFRYLLAMRYLQTLEKIADSPSVKLFLPAGPEPNALLLGAYAQAPTPPPPGKPESD
ncbi:paraslipin [Myxococcota bacterium]|nr:paraslipin [Myxococcota bacterium]MBU1430651.1 paraslipin [Myxococcota bacterium]MBU1899262.1 paraslipin [Myxococcota bacterium]